MKGQNIKIVEIEEGEESKLKDPENIFNNIIQETQLNIKDRYYFKAED